MSTAEIDDTLFVKLYRQVHESITTQEFSLADFTVLVMTCMQIVEQIKDMRGARKKRLVVRLVKRFIADVEVGEVERELLLKAVDALLPDLIDGMVDASKGKLFPLLAKKWCKCL